MFEAGGKTAQRQNISLGCAAIPAVKSVPICVKLMLEMYIYYRYRV